MGEGEKDDEVGVEVERGKIVVFFEPEAALRKVRGFLGSEVWIRGRVVAGHLE